MVAIEKINDHLACFKVPYKDIFVGIYVLRTAQGTVLFDAAATDDDVNDYILPALAQLGVVPTHIFISHNHKDHAGGLARAAALFPEAVILTRSEELIKKYPHTWYPEDGETLLDVLQVVTIPGHTLDSMALLDTRTGTLVSGDCLQAYGIYGSGFWYGAIGFPVEHFAAVEKLRKLPIQTVATAHDYHPCGMVSRGENAVAERLDQCIDALLRVLRIAKENPELDADRIADICNDGSLPKVAPRIVAALRAAEGRL